LYSYSVRILERKKNRKKTTKEKATRLKVIDDCRDRHVNIVEFDSLKVSEINVDRKKVLDNLHSSN